MQSSTSASTTNLLSARGLATAGCSRYADNVLLLVLLLLVELLRCCQCSVCQSFNDLLIAAACVIAWWVGEGRQTVVCACMSVGCCQPSTTIPHTLNHLLV